MTLDVKDAFAVLPKSLRDELLHEFNEIVKNYREHRWEPSELKGGRLCEVVYTIVDGWLANGKYPPKGKKPPNFLQACLNLEKNHVKTPSNHSARILMPRMMLGLYDIRNNRGVGHVGGDVDPNLMDATAVLYLAKWLMAELVRLLHALTTEEASAIVDDLIEREVAWVWSHGSMKRVLKAGLGFKKQTLLLLLTTHGDVAEGDLFKWVEHKNAANYRRDVLKPLHRERLIEYDHPAGTVRLLSTGVDAAEALVATL